MLRWRGDLVEAANTWSATLPSISRGTSTWPRSERRSRSRPHSSESAWRSATHSSAWSARARSEATYGGARAVTHSRASVRPTTHPAAEPWRQRHAAVAAAPSAPIAAAIRARRLVIGTGRAAVRTSSRKASERASRSSATRTKSRSAASVSRSMAGARRSVGDGLDVEALVGLEQLDRLERDPRPVVARTGTALAQDPAERRHPAEPLVRLDDPVAFDAAVDLGPLAELVEQVHLVPARDPAGRHRGVEQLVGPARAACTAARPRGAPRATGRRARPGTRRSPPISSESRRLSQAWPTLTWVTTSNVRPRASATVSSANGSRLPPSRDVGRRTPLAIALSLPPVGVMSVRTRSASPRSKRERTIASVV